MRLRFLGTRGNIDAQSPRHRRHSTLEHRRHRAPGADRLRRGLALQAGGAPAGGDRRHSRASGPRGRSAPRSAVPRLHHSGGLADHAPLGSTRPRGASPRTGPRVCGLRITPFAVVHSLRAPALGYRISAGGVRLFYVPDVVSIPREREALSGINLYGRRSITSRSSSGTRSSRRPCSTTRTGFPRATAGTSRRWRGRVRWRRLPRARWRPTTSISRSTKR
jgi:hypothetical protein